MAPDHGHRKVRDDIRHALGHARIHRREERRLPIEAMHGKAKAVRVRDGIDARSQHLRERYRIAAVSRPVQAQGRVRRLGLAQAHVGVGREFGLRKELARKAARAPCAEHPFRVLRAFHGHRRALLRVDGAEVHRTEDVMLRVFAEIGLRVAACGIDEIAAVGHVQAVERARRGGLDADARRAVARSGRRHFA